MCHCAWVTNIMHINVLLETHYQTSQFLLEVSGETHTFLSSITATLKKGLFQTITLLTHKFLLIPLDKLPYTKHKEAEKHTDV